MLVQLALLFWKNGKNQQALTGDAIILFFFRLFLSWVQFRLAPQILSLNALRSSCCLQKEKEKNTNRVSSASIAGSPKTGRSASWVRRCYNSPFSVVCLSCLLFRMAPQILSLKALTSFLPLKSNGASYRKSVDYFSTDGLSPVFGSIFDGG